MQLTSMASSLHSSGERWYFRYRCSRGASIPVVFHQARARKSTLRSRAIILSLMFKHDWDWGC
eukprot:scaffold3503_cov215-Chaetoceros_neogracile.AAC.2